MGDERRKDLAMRLAIFVSLALATGFASYGASACEPWAQYNDKIAKAQGDYQEAVNTAYKSYYYGVRYNKADWENAVGTALTNYMTESRAAYNNHMVVGCWW
jgi:hypothetical protein